MTTPVPTDQEIAAGLQAALLAEAEQVTPEPALHQILARAHEAGRAKPIRRRRTWVPVLGGAVATAGLAAAAIVIFAPGEEPTPTPEPSVSCAVEVHEGCQVDLAVWYQLDAQVLSGSVTVTSSGDVGMDAVNALLTTQPSQGHLVNPWSGLLNTPQPVAEVNSVTHADQVVTVDFDRPLDQFPSVQGAGPEFGELTVQQLVLTVQSALRTDDPVQITVNGEPADEAFGYPLPDSIQSDWSMVSGIRLETPAQRMAVTSPVTISGQSMTYEANILWEVTQDGEVVRGGHTMGGAPGTYERFDITVQLDPGEYTIKLWEPNTASGPEAWTDEIAVVYTDFVVE